MMACLGSQRALPICNGGSCLERTELSSLMNEIGRSNRPQVQVGGAFN